MAPVIYYPAPHTPFSPDELRAEFAKLSPRDPLARALMQVLTERLAAATVQATSPTLGEREAGHVSGRLSEIASLQAELASYWQPARKAK